MPEAPKRFWTKVVELSVVHHQPEEDGKFFNGANGQRQWNSHLSWYAAKLHMEKKGMMEVLLKTTGYEKLRLTVMLAATADGRKLPPLLILKRKTLPKSEAFLKDIIVRAQEKEWMMEDMILEWLKIVWGRRPRAFLNQPSMIVLDAFKGHLTDPVKNKLRKMKLSLLSFQVEWHQCCNQWTYPLTSPLKRGWGNNIWPGLQILPVS